MASLLLVSGPLFGGRVPLAGPPLGEAVIGRLSSASLQLPSAQVSRLHARLFLRGERWWVEDAGSRNGTRLNNERVTQPQVLTAGDVIRVGDVAMIFDTSAALYPARYGQAWVLVASDRAPPECTLAPVGQFLGDSADLAGITHLLAATVEEEALVRGILQLVADRLALAEAALVRVSRVGDRYVPLGVVAASGPVPVHAGLLSQVIDSGRATMAPRVERVILRDEALLSTDGGPVLYAPLKLEGGVHAVLCLTRPAGVAPFTLAELGRAAAVAAVFAPALDNARRAQMQRRRHRAWVEPEKSEAVLAGKSPLARRLSDEVRQAADDDGPLMVVGEHGVGKERVARLIHAWSQRWEGPLVQVSCADRSESQLELLLFGRAGGHEADGADRAAESTGEARLDRPVMGKAALAEGGTVILEQIHLMPPGVQDRLLRLLQSGHLWRLRAQRAAKVDVRVITTSELGPAALQGQAGFRPDLLQILSRRVIEVPTLRDRKADLVPLVDEILARVCIRLGKPIRRVTDEAYNFLRQQRWTGNLRELEAVLTRAVSFGADEVLSAEDVELGGDAAASPSPGARSSDTLAGTLKDSERRLLRQAMTVAGGDPAQAASLMGMTRRAFERRWLHLGLEGDLS